MNTNLLRKCDALRTLALRQLGKYYCRAEYITDLGCDKLGFRIYGNAEDYAAIAWIDGEWELFDNRGSYISSAYTIPLQDLCKIVQEITDKFE